MSGQLTKIAVCCCAVGAAAVVTPLSLADEADLKDQLKQLQQQNEQLQRQLQRQQRLMESLSRKVAEIEGDNAKREQETAATPVEATKPFSFGKVLISGEGGLAFFESGRDGQFPNAEFRVDEAKLFLDAQVWDNVYFFTELNITTREEPNENLRVGELYVDFENVSHLWNRERMLNVRAGRFDIPFGEEYLVRDAVDNPLISHSLSDLWGVDEGVELYGSLGKFDYVLAVQNGGRPTLRDFNTDKAVVGRIGFEPNKQLRLSASAMRTGDLDVAGDKTSELWFGDGFIRALGAAATEFHAELVEGDVQLRFPRGHVKAAGGYVHSNDNDPVADDERDVYYYYIEGLYKLTDKFYGAARFSQIRAHKGFPIVGQGEFEEYFEEELTKSLWRLSLGVGYRFSSQLVLKAEYSFERGEELGGDKRNHEDQFGLELAYRF